MIFKSEYDSAEAVPQEFKDSFKVVEGKFVFTGQIETKDTTDYKELHNAKKSTFDEMHGLKDKVKEAEARATKAESDYEVLKLQPKEGAVSEEEIQKLVETRVNVRTEALTKENEDLKNLNSDFQGKIHSGDKSSFLSEIKGELSESYIKENGFMFDTFLNNVFERQEDGSHLTKEFDKIPAGLNKTEAVAKLIELNPQLAKQNTPTNNNGSDGNNASGTKATQLAGMQEKAKAGTLTPREANQMISLAHEVKNENNTE